MTDSKQTSSPAGSMRELLQIALPLVISAGSLALMNVVDRAFLSQLSMEAIAACMPASMFHWTVVSIPLGITSYSNAFISQYEGANRKDRVAATIWQGIFVAIFSTALLLPSILFVEQIFALMGHTPAVQELEVKYFSVLVWVSLPLLTTTVLSAFFTCRHRTQVVMWVNIVTSILNAVLDPMFIFGYGLIPKMGIQGAALATLIAQVTSCVVFIVLLIQDARRHQYPLRATFRIDPGLARRMFRYGFPQGIQLFLDIGAFMTFLALVGQLGTQAQAATTLAFTINSLAFVPMFGMGTAVMTIVGHRIGEARPQLAKTTVWKAFILSGTYMLAFAAIYLLIPDLLLRSLVDSSAEGEYESIRDSVVTLLRFVALYSFFDAMAIVFGSAIRGAGDTKFSLVFTVITGWLLMVFPTMYVVRWGGESLGQETSLYVSWGACTIFIVVLGFGFLFRFLQGKWLSMRVIETEDPLVD